MAYSTEAVVQGITERPSTDSCKESPTAPPTLKELSNALSSVTDWHTLGVKLGVESCELERIEQDYPRDNKRCKHAMLDWCLQSANSLTWRMIADALRQMGKHRIASEIQIEHPSSFTATATAPPTLKELSNALSSVTDWHTLGVKLGVESCELERIEQNYPRDNNRCKHAMLDCCLQSANSLTWEMIADALCQMGKHRIANEIQIEHPSSFTATEAEAAGPVQPPVTPPTNLQSDPPPEIVVKCNIPELESEIVLNLLINPKTKTHPDEGYLGKPQAVKVVYDEDIDFPMLENIDKKKDHDRLTLSMEQAHVKIQDVVFSILEIPPSGTVLVKDHRDQLLGAVDLSDVLADLGSVGYITQTAYNGVVGCTNLQTVIREIGCNITKLCHKSAVTVAKFRQVSNCILGGLQGTYQSLFNSRKDMVIETLIAVISVAKDMTEAADQLHKEFDEESVRVKQTLKETMRTKGSEEERISKITVKAALFWKQIREHCEQQKMQRWITIAVKKPEKGRIRVWTTSSFKKTAVEYYAHWAALEDVCAIYMRKIQETQKDLYSYLQENPTLSKLKRVQILALTFRKELETEQKAIAQKEFPAP